MSVDYLVVASSKRELEGFLTKEHEPVPYAGKLIVFACVGVGNVQAGINTLDAIYRYQPKAVLGLGYAGGIDPALQIGDGVVATSVVQYDVDLQSFGLKRGEVFGPQSKQVLGEITLFAPYMEGTRQGKMGSANQFLLRSYREANPWLVDELSLVSSDMESYGIALSAVKKEIPCTIFRVVSDDSLGHRPKDYKKFCLQANQKFVDFLYKLLESPKEKSPTNL
ncbi:MAG: 5'-methylthioadenosine/S-adenosylhomocysteine nucleosidase [Sphaerochaeta sp.]|nr:5'-methylthioadenosine/S-adenosylhomocysteine nucleosidase [Sphaerochaeta sp.]